MCHFCKFYFFLSDQIMVYKTCVIRVLSIGSLKYIILFKLIFRDEKVPVQTLLWCQRLLRGVTNVTANWPLPPCTSIRSYDGRTRQ